MAEPWEVDWKAQATPASPAADAEPWNVDWKARPAHEPSLAHEAAAVATSPIQGLAMLGGTGGDLAHLAKSGADWLGDKLPDIPSPAPDSTLGRLHEFLKQESARSNHGMASVGHGDLPGSYVPPTSEQLRGSIENVTGPLPDAETTSGKLLSAPGKFLPAAVVTGGEAVVPSIVKGAVLPGMASEYLGHKAEGTWLEPYARLLGAIGGGVAGAAGGKGVEALANRSAASSAAAEAGVPRASLAKVAKNFEADELTPQAVATRQAELGPEAMMLDMGRQMQGRAEAIASQPGKGQNKVLDAVEGRTGTFGSGTAERTKDTLDQSMGPSRDIVATRDGINAAVDRIAKPLYDNVMTAHPVVDVPVSITSRPVVAQAMKDAEQLAKNHGENITGTKETKTILSGDGYHIAEDVTNPAKTSLRYWDYVKKALDSRINGMMKTGGIQDLDSAGKADLGGLMDAKTALVKHLDNTTDGAYAVARRAAATKFQVNDAIDLGRSALNTKLLPEELAEHMGGMSIPERAGVQLGMRREIDRIIDTARNDGAAARRLLDTNQNREKIVHVFGKDAADVVDKRIASETQFQDATNKISANSRTAVRSQLMKDTEAPSQSGPPMANLTGFAVSAARRGQQYLGDLSLERTKAGIGDLLTRKGNDIPSLAQILSDYNAARAANVAAPVGQQTGRLASVLSSQVPSWFNYLPATRGNQSQ